MSMLGEQIKELREAARNTQGKLGRCLYRRKDVDEMQKVSGMLSEAADTINSLRDRLQKAGSRPHRDSGRVQEHEEVVRMSDLKPCPFCGGNAVLDEYASGEMNITVDHKDECWLMDYEHVLDCPSDEKDAYIKAWNTRAKTQSNVDGSRWHELFGTPERAARTIAGIKCDDGGCEGCTLYGANCSYDENAMLGWLKDELRGDAE